MLIDGTSASAPVMAAFMSLVNAQRKSKNMSTMGYINPFLYKYYASFTNDITSGDNKWHTALALPSPHPLSYTDTILNILPNTILHVITLTPTMGGGPMIMIFLSALW